MYHNPIRRRAPRDDDWAPITALPERAGPWLAALESAGIPCDPEETDSGAVLWVPTSRLARALAELRSYEKANVGWPPPHPAVADENTPGAVIWSVFLAALLVCFHLVAGGQAGGGAFPAAGMLDVDRVADGEWWRLVTSLTLHADFAHVGANAAALAVLGIAASHQLGPGLAWLLGLAGGAGGNALEAWLAPSGRCSLGASTSVFAFLAILGGLRFVAICRREGPPRSVWARSWLPLFAALGALGFLGTSHGSDVAGHALGFVSGLALGVLAGILPRRRPPELWQFALCGLSALAVGWAWHAALAGAGDPGSGYSFLPVSNMAIIWAR